MVEELSSMTLQLAKCQYGNYILQYILDASPEHFDRIFQLLLSRLPELSCNKFGSNVIEKVIKKQKGGCIEALVRTITASNEYISTDKE
jgi:hypothetical protein